MKTQTQSPSEIWAEIKGKADYYKTAMHWVSGKFVGIIGHNGNGSFYVRFTDGDTAWYGCHELTDYCL